MPQYLQTRLVGRPGMTPYWFRRLFKCASIALLSTLLLAILLLVVIIERSPRAQANTELTPGTTLLAEAAGQRAIKQFLQAESLQLHRPELEALLAIAGHAYPEFSTQLMLAEQQAELRVSYPLWSGRAYLNLTLQAGDAESKWLHRLQLGKLRVPGPWLLPALRLSGSVLPASDELAELLAGIQQLSITPELVRFRLVLSEDEQQDTQDWSPLQQLTAIAPAELRRYQQQLYQFQRDTAATELSAYLMAAFQLAGEQSQRSGSSLQHEHRAALLALASFFGTDHFRWLFWGSSEGQGLLSSSIQVTLAGREDLLLHFVYSAAIEALSNRRIAWLAGEMKELLDTNPGRSGFSFVDLLADKAGLYFASQALSSKASATRLQQQLARGIDDSDLLPAFDALQEGIQYEHFIRYYTNLESEAYQKQLAALQQKLGAMPLYRGKD
ncbi:hypothetical protein Q3O59_03605 [Alkalimonas delamerensis]|uniref:Uncharacterized protein n=1 Tax=Alkalimonas delamerensis TaxID=265981 RepID=A0ABT9GMU4_9GAMM|nr:hypothetical protein [Alkalimonas delamerensis]MDP4528115.1 hypothetical protein [Alkalimonas delamerensis]